MDQNTNSEKHLIESGALLDTWAKDPWDNGVQVDGMEDMQKLEVRTLNSLYEIVIIDARRGHLLVRGGRFFPQLTPVYLAGATLGGSFCKMKGIYVGFCMEFGVSRQRIITSYVQTIAVFAQDSGDREILYGKSGPSSSGA